jgi:hypothetical protein
MTQDKRIRIMAGHFGSGKTEFAVNYAVKLRTLGTMVGLADLDIINPYFRSRERDQLFREKGIKLVGSSQGSAPVDMPALSPEINAFIEDPAWQAVIDVGGDPTGARVLGRYAAALADREYDFFLVINAYRPETRTAGQVEDMIEGIQGLSRLKITGLVNTTHLLKDTVVDDVARGYELAREVSVRTGLPVRYNAAIASVAAQLPADWEGEIFPLELFMRDLWMS